MELTELLAKDPNTLPYFITEARTQRTVPVRFERLAAEDEAELNGAEWAEARFVDVWREFIGEGRTLKLVCVEEQDRRIQGLVRIGEVTRADGSLKRSLLETAPFNRQEAGEQRAYRGVGRVLVARLVVESYQQGGRGKVTVRAARGTAPFYRAIGFKDSPRWLDHLLLDEAEAAELLQAVLISQPRGSWVTRLWQRLRRWLGGETK